MKKNHLIKKAVALASSLALSLCSSLSASASNYEESKDDSYLVPKSIYEQIPAQEAYSALCSSFSLTKDGTYLYPDDYAGAWYDSGMLYVAVTDADSIQNYKLLLDNYSCVQYNVTEYSLNELDDIRSVLFDNIHLEYPVVSNYVDCKANKISWGVIDMGNNQQVVESRPEELV